MYMYLKVRLKLNHESCLQCLPIYFNYINEKSIKSLLSGTLKKQSGIGQERDR